IRDKLVTGVQTCALPISSVKPAAPGGADLQQPSLHPVIRPPKPFFLRSWFGFASALLIVVSLVVGWQVSQIDPALLYRKAPEMRSEERRVGKECRSGTSR